MLWANPCPLRAPSSRQLAVCPWQLAGPVSNQQNFAPLSRLSPRPIQDVSSYYTLFFILPTNSDLTTPALHTGPLSYFQCLSHSNSPTHASCSRPLPKKTHDLTAIHSSRLQFDNKELVVCILHSPGARSGERHQLRFPDAPQKPAAPVSL